MRRTSSLVLLALAVFCTALAPLLRWYAYPRLVKIPPNQYQVAVLQADDATLLDYRTLRPRKHRETVSIVQTLKGNVPEARRAKARTGRDVVVWDALSYVADADGEMISQIPERYVFDAHTQEPVHVPGESGAGESVDGEPVRRQGVEFKFPFRTERRDYYYFDAQTRTSAPIHYRGTRSFRGLTVYYFEQTIPWTRVPTPKRMPLGVTPEVVERVGLERWYTTVRMFWVDPVTGAPVNGEERHREEMRYTGRPDKKPLVAFDGHVRMRADYLDHVVGLVKSQRTLVLLLVSWVPWTALGLGAALLAAALGLEARGRRKGPGQAAGSRPAAESVPV